jgi:presenilin-like A22 family membrane protease
VCSVVEVVGEPLGVLGVDWDDLVARDPLTDSPYFKKDAFKSMGMAETGSAVRSSVVPFIVMGSLFVVVDLLALLLVGPFIDAGIFAFEDSGNPLNVAYFLLMILLATGVILALGRFRGGRFVKWILFGIIWFSLFSALYSLSFFVVDDPLAVSVSVICSLALIASLVRWPRWYLIDASAILLGTTTMVVIGISLSAPLVAILLIGLAVYDAIAVYKTGHMLTLAELVINSGLPLMLIVPKMGGYGGNVVVKIRRGVPLAGEERRAFYMGLGDIVLPGCLAVSIYSSLGFGGLVVVGSVVLGTLVGFAMLSKFVSRGSPQAGLPFLCSGAVLGYVFSSVLLFGRIVGL